MRKYKRKTDQIPIEYSHPQVWDGLSSLPCVKAMTLSSSMTSLKKGFIVLFGSPEMNPAFVLYLQIDTGLNKFIVNCVIQMWNLPLDLT
jgi:hypothetical protein